MIIFFAAFKNKALRQAILVMVCFGFLLGCGETEEKQARKNESDQQFSLAQARDAVWPPPVNAPIERYDPLLTRQNFMAVLDMSGSMSDTDCSGQFDTKAEAARFALVNWLESIPREANVGLVVFSRKAVKVYVPLGVDNRDVFQKAVQKTFPSGGTPLRTAMELALRELEERARHQNGYGDYRLVVITDGQHSEGEDPKPVVDAILNNPANPIQIYTIGFCITESALNQPGRIIYQSANNPDELKKGLDRVLAESTHFNIDAIKEFTKDD